MPHCVPAPVAYFRQAMTNAFRFLLVSFLAVLISTGLIGCAVFSASAGETLSAPVAQTPAGMAMHVHHGAHEMAATSDPAPAHDHGDADCDGCTQTLLNRVSITPDAGLAPNEVPAPVFIIPLALQLDPQPVMPVRQHWPPGDEAPPRPSTLTHQKISLLI